ncbi:hypothetical protein GCM10009827_087450 [Dactylosporangium maewongense]|uniref:Formate hydrogenlyase regulatory protein HycA n=1 Tax=Dactylosporangium maewongense TaxID=634393 RepID=A0ABP4MZY4_9ACTN
MAMPQRIPIAHEPDHRTDTIGRYAAGYFYAAVHGARRDVDDLDESFAWYAYVHRFDHDGRHEASTIRRIAVSRYLTDPEAANRILATLLDELDAPRFDDIAIQPFRLTYDGVLFGLVDESDADRGDWAELYPDRLGFTQPWDGSYST